MFITPAYAQLMGGGGTGLNAFETLLPILFILPIMYFLVLRPQQLKLKQHREMITKVARGDTVKRGRVKVAADHSVETLADAAAHAS